MQSALPVVQMPFGQDVEIDLFGYGTDWRIADPDDKLTPAGTEIAAFAASKGVTEIIAPRARFTRNFAHSADLEKGVIVADVSSGSQVKILRGSKDYGADAAEIKRGQAFFIASGDCPTLILYHPKLPLLCAHAGRDCLWDRAHIEDEMLPTSPYESIVNALMNQVPEGYHHEIRAYITCGINAIDYHHSIEKNIKMLFHFKRKSTWCVRGHGENVQLSLVDIIADQLRRLKVPYNQITFDHVNTFRDRCTNGTPQWWSHRRWATKEGGKGIDGRNGVLVIFKK